MDLRSWFNEPRHSDLLLQVYLAKQPDPTRKRKHDEDAAHGTTPVPSPACQQPARTYHMHAIVLSTASRYFQALLSTDDWQPVKAECSHSKSAGGEGGGSSCCKRQLEWQVQDGELQAMDCVLRLMYGHALPLPDASAGTLCQCLELADRLEAVGVIDALLDHMTAPGVLAPEILQYAAKCYNREPPPGVSSRAGFKRLEDLCFSYCVETLCKGMPKGGDETDEALAYRASWYYIAVCFCYPPAMFRDSRKLLRRFCKLPFPALLAWLEEQLLEINSDNEVLFLMTQWVNAQKAEPPSGEQLAQLLERVCMRDLGPAYMHLILPNLPWVQRCFKTAAGQRLQQYLQLLNAYHTPGLGYEPRELLSEDTDVNRLKWPGPVRWIGCGQGLPGCYNLTYLIRPEEVPLVEEGGSETVMSVYYNGFFVRLAVWAETPAAASEGAEADTRLCFSQHIDVAGMRRHGIPWSDTAAVFMQSLFVRLVGPGGKSTQSDSKDGAQLMTAGSRPQMAHLVLGKAGTPLQELLAPWLTDGGQLHFHVALGEVDPYIGMFSDWYV